ncbi:MAG: histidine kinase [Bifidobacteriaceae bacterium]|nr:histidine kinase [Bifidobacteriaceae bacterium]
MLTRPVPDGGLAVWLPGPVAALALGAVLLALFARSRYPIVLLVVAAGGSAVDRLEDPYPTFGFLLALHMGVFFVAVAVPLIRAAMLTVGAFAVELAVSTLISRPHVPTYDILIFAGLAVAVTATGQMVRTRVALAEATAQREIEADRTRQARARQALAEQRLDMARELHDSVGHGIVTMGLYAQAAARALAQRPEEVLRCLQVVQDTSQTLVEDLGDVLRDLRGGQHSLAGTDEGLDHLEDLVREAGDLGVDVRLHVHGEIAPLDGTVSRAAYQIVKEGLLNARKHGSSRHEVDVMVTRQANWLSVIVRNRLAGPSGRGARGGDLSTGHGLVGMRERAESVGGWMSASHGGRTYVVEANLPVSETAA